MCVDIVTSCGVLHDEGKIEYSWRIHQVWVHDWGVGGVVVPETETLSTEITLGNL